MNYCAGWMRQQENQQLGIPRDVAKGFSPRLRKLVGYGGMMLVGEDAYFMLLDCSRFATFTGRPVGSLGALLTDFTPRRLYRYYSYLPGFAGRSSAPAAPSGPAPRLDRRGDTWAS